jgi:hypothetical protein
MSHLLVKSLALGLAILICSECRLPAFCAKCMKIEEDRAREQAEHPQPAGYYDDYIGMADEKPKTKEKVTEEKRTETKRSSSQTSKKISEEDDD